MQANDHCDEAKESCFQIPSLGADFRILAARGYYPNKGENRAAGIRKRGSNKGKRCAEWILDECSRAVEKR